MDHRLRIARSPHLRFFAVDEQTLIDTVTDALKQRSVVKEDRKLGRAAILSAHLSGGHFALHLKTCLIPNEGRSVRNVPSFEKFLLLMKDAFYLVLTVAGRIASAREFDDGVAERQLRADHRRTGRVEQMPVTLKDRHRDI